MVQQHLHSAEIYVKAGYWLCARHALCLALGKATPSQRGHILRALKACKLAIAERP